MSDAVMQMDVAAIEAKVFEPIEHRYAARDTILYALGLGYGEDPLDEQELPFVYERMLRAVPAMVNILAHPGFWAQDSRYGIDWVKLLHAEQAFDIHATLPPEATVRGVYRVAGIEDKGEQRGALLHQEKTLYDAAAGTKLATVRSTLMLRGNGGQGSFGTAIDAAPPLSDRSPDRSVEIATLPRQALLYRLNGDWNPLHIDPLVAQRAGFDRPILHGLCTNGIACRAVLRAYADNEPARLRSMFTRFSKPVMPGETIRFDFFEDGEEVRFRAIALGRGEIVLDRCRATLA